MYKIDILTAGKYNNVALGSRYCFSARKARKLIKLLREFECVILVTKFIKCADCWCWSEDHKLIGE